MPALQVRDCPTELYEQLKVCAAREHRSISQQVVVCIEQFLSGSAPTPASRYNGELSLQQIERRKALFEQIAARPIVADAVDFPSAVELIREDRDAR